VNGEGRGTTREKRKRSNLCPICDGSTRNQFKEAQWNARIEGGYKALGLTEAQNDEEVDERTGEEDIAAGFSRSGLGWKAGAKTGEETSRNVANMKELFDDLPPGCVEPVEVGGFSSAAET